MTTDERQAPTVSVDVPWATGTVPIAVERSRVAGVLRADVENAVDPDGLLRAAIERPGDSLKGFLTGAHSPLLMVINDATRPTPSAQVLRVIRGELEQWLDSPRRELSFVIATGTHRAALPDEIERLVGPDIARAYAGRITSHDARDDSQLVRIGRTPRGTDVEVNRLLADARSVLLINSVEPHYFAGYTGGRKSLFPGLAGYRTVWANHKLSMQHGSETLRLEGNPVHEDLEEALKIGVMGKDIYSIQMVLGKEHNIGFATAGSLEPTFRAAVAVAERQYVLDIDRPCEVVVAVAPHPMDCNLYQTNKAIQSGAAAVKDGGILVVVSECPFGLGENQTLYDTLSEAASPSAALQRVNLEEYRLGAQQAARIAGILQRSEIWAVTSLPPSQVSSMFMRPFGDIQSAVDAALAARGPDAQVLFLLEASITVPRIRS